MLDKGYKFFFELEMDREKFLLDEMEICLENIRDFGLGIEVEVMATLQESEEVKKRIKHFLDTIGIPEEDILPKSITNIVMHQRGF